ncbi:MAG: hypothetical protein IT173_12050 [Acidobacteria bacterium]|nr:hypothetical protein [Acidobacteriota bacterium]
MPETAPPIRRYSLPQMNIISDLCQRHLLDPTQIAFEGDDLNPIFDYEAVSLLSLRLTDIQTIDCSLITHSADGRSTCECTVMLTDGRSRTVSDSAAIGEEMPGGTRIADVRLADSVARSRASRLGIRSVGINLYHAHKRFRETGGIAVASTDSDPRAAALRELHVLATELDLIVDGDKTAYQQFIADSFEGKTSSTHLNDLDFQRLLNQLRAMARHTRSRKTVPA